MKPFGFGLVTAVLVTLFAGVMALPSGASAQTPARTPPVPQVTAQQRTAGMAAAPAIITAGNLPCTLADARLIGQSGRGAAQQTFYEFACTNQLGFVVAARPSQPPQAFTCLETATQPNPANGVNPLHCILPGNLNQTPALQTYVTHGGMPCTIGQVRPIGQTATNTLFELKCTEGEGYIMTTTAPPNPTGAVVMVPCLAFDGTGNVNCTLSDRAALLARIDTFNTQSDRHCPVRDRRYVLTTRQGATYYEIACQDNTGYMLEVASTGAVGRTIPCANADYVGGGCTLTNGREAQTQQAGLYTTLATRAGFNCQVQQYAALQGPRGMDVVELKCSNRPDGAIGIFPATGTGTVIPCAHALASNPPYRCTFTTEAQQYPQLTADLRSQGKDSCAVAGMRFVGVTADGKAYIEVSCADGLAGYFLEFTREPTIRPTQAIACSFARGIGGGCTLPSNVAAARGSAPAAPAGRPAAGGR